MKRKSARRPSRASLRRGFTFDCGDPKHSILHFLKFVKREERREEIHMQYKLNGYYPNDVACVYGYDSRGHRVMIYKGYFNYKRGTITLYPFSRLVPSSESFGKVTIPIAKLGKEKNGAS